MDALAAYGSAGVWAFALGVALLAGLVKGMVGFAMPMILISGLGSVMSPELALAGLIVPTLITNLWQAFRQGAGAVWLTLRRYWRFLLAGFVLLLGSAQLVRVLPQDVMLLILGVPIMIFALMGLAGRPLRLPSRPGALTEAAIGAVAGFFGGISGIWGPPTVAMLTAQDTEKRDQIRVQGVIYGLGALALLGAHAGSGVLRAETLPFSLVLTVPAVAGMLLGFRFQDRIDQRAFQRLTLVVLLIAGANLIRRGLLLM